jgi:fibronectin type 3 domain-containing protein
VLAAGWLGCAQGGLRPETTARTPALVEAPTSELAAPVGLVARSGALRCVPLQWDPSLRNDVGGYVVERASEPEGAFERVGVAAGRLQTRTRDCGPGPAPARGEAGHLPDGATFYYRLRAFDLEGRVSGLASAVVGATTAAPPPAPQGIRAWSGLPRSVLIAWEPSSDPTAAGYVVRRSPSADGPFEPIAMLDGANATSYVDPGLGDLRVLYYRIATRSRAGAEGPTSPSHRAVTKPKPLPPHRLRVASQRLGSNRLAWEPNVEPDLAGYRVLRLRPGSPTATLVAEVGPDDHEVEDTGVLPEESVDYVAEAFDADGLTSARAGPLAVECAGYALEATLEPGGVALAWDLRGDEGFVAARVRRVGRFGRRELARVEADRFLDAGVQPGHARYEVVLERADGSLAPPSPVLELRIPPGAPAAGPEAGAP